MYSEIITIILGALAGFVSSYFFWRKDSLKDRPRINIKSRYGEVHEGTCVFDLKNEGFTHAINLAVIDHPFGDCFGDLAPGETLPLRTLREDEEVEEIIKYEDPWGAQYKAKWKLRGPHRFEVEDGQGIYTDEQISREHENITSTFSSKIKRYLP